LGRDPFVVGHLCQRSPAGPWYRARTTATFVLLAVSAVPYTIRRKEPNGAAFSRPSALPIPGSRNKPIPCRLPPSMRSKPSCRLRSTEGGKASPAAPRFQTEACRPHRRPSGVRLRRTRSASRRGNSPTRKQEMPARPPTAKPKGGQALHAAAPHPAREALGWEVRWRRAPSRRLLRAFRRRLPQVLGRRLPQALGRLLRTFCCRFPQALGLFRQLCLPTGLRRFSPPHRRSCRSTASPHTSRPSRSRDLPPLPVREREPDFPRDSSGEPHPHLLPLRTDLPQGRSPPMPRSNS